MVFTAVNRNIVDKIYQQINCDFIIMTYHQLKQGLLEENNDCVKQLVNLFINWLGVVMSRVWTESRPGRIFANVRRSGIARFFQVPYV